VIVTVTLNPALQVEYDAKNVRAGESNQVSQVRYRAAGRGLAVATILHTFGHDVVAAGLAGGSAGELIRTQLARAGVATQFTRITAETRRVTMVSDSSSGAMTSFAEPAPYITTEELGRLAADYRALLAGATAIVLCGSLPDSLPAETYGSFVSYAADAGVPVLLNASGAALAHGAARRPALVVPEPGSDRELASLDPAGPRSVALLTRHGVRVLTHSGQWLASLGPSASAEGPPGRPGTADVLDALVAGFVPGVALAWSWPDILRHAIALAAAWSPAGELEVQAYEDTLTAVNVQRLRGDHG
jgi:tagatose 6-phosphate kinase